jgi:hypothetical protein
MGLAPGPGVLGGQEQGRGGEGLAAVFKGLRVVVGAGIDGAAALGNGFEVLGRDGEHAGDVAAAGCREGASEFQAKDGLEDGLDAGAIIQGDGVRFAELAVYFGDVGGDLVAPGHGSAGAAKGVLALLFPVGGVVVDAEAGFVAGGEAAGAGRSASSCRRHMA